MLLYPFEVFSISLPHTGCACDLLSTLIDGFTLSTDKIGLLLLKLFGSPTQHATSHTSYCTYGNHEGLES